MSLRSVGLGLVALAAVVIGVATTLTLDSRAQETIDVSGDWTIVVEGDVATTCTATFTQSPEGALSGDVSCVGVGSGMFAGTIDPATGDFEVSGSLIVGVNLEGTASADGESISGTWSAFGLGGTFSGTPAIDDPAPSQPGFDLSGDWDASFSGFLSGTCDAAMQQAGAELFVAVDCMPLGAGAFRGDIDSEARSFALDGDIGGLSASLRGTVVEDEESVAGQWVAFAVFSGDFEADRVDRTPSFVDVTGRWNVALAPIENVPGVADDCTIVLEQTVDEVTGSVECTELGSSMLFGTIQPLTGALSVASAEGERIHVFEGSLTDGTLAGLWIGGAGLQAAEFTGSRKAGPAGDANCDAAVTSVDATLLLQMDAGLIDTVPCPEFADPNGDGAINSIDSAMALQRSAGLLALLV